jgi:hypothetical protein
MYGGQPKNAIPKFEIPLSATTDPKSSYYFKTIENKLARLDTTIYITASHAHLR